jgi:hypothetical protein
MKRNSGDLRCGTLVAFLPVTTGTPTNKRYLCVAVLDSASYCA